MPYLQLALEVDAACCPALEAALEEWGALAVTYQDPGGAPVLEPAVGANPLWDRVRVVALFAEDAPLQAIEQSLRAALPERESPVVQVEALADRCWERAWIDDFKPMRFGERLWVCPTNIEPPQPEAVNLRLDPGLAFGTGTHPTTGLCLNYLDRTPLAGADVVDFGCGSGILGVAALLLGAHHCYAIDNDPQALQAARENAQRNAVAERMSILAPERLPPLSADGVIANILAGVLIELAPVLRRQVRDGGWIALSGILEAQAPDVSRVYGQWFELEAPQSRDGWVLLCGRKR